MRLVPMTRIKAILVLVAALAFAGAPFLARSFRGYDPADFPNPVTDPSIQPAGYAFSIWLLIYLWLIAHAAYGLVRRDLDPDWDRTRWPLILSLALGASWLEAAQIAPVTATVQIWLMLASAAVALVRAPRGKDRWWLIAPIALYTGWLTAAASVSAGVVLIGYGIGSETSVTIAMLVVALALAVGLQLKAEGAPEYGLAVIWALIGIMVANLDDHMGVFTIVAAGMAAVSAAIIRATQ